MEDWNSHQYKNENNIKSCLKRKTKKDILNCDNKLIYEKERDRVIYDEPHLDSYRRGNNILPQSRPFQLRHGNFDESVFITDKGTLNVIIYFILSFEKDNDLTLFTHIPTIYILTI